MGMSEEMDAEKAYAASPPATKPAAERLQDDLHWFTREFAQEFPERAGGIDEALARYGFMRGLLRASEFYGVELKAIKEEVVEAVTAVRELVSESGLTQAEEAEWAKQEYEEHS